MPSIGGTAATAAFVVGTGCAVAAAWMSLNPDGQSSSSPLKLPRRQRRSVYAFGYGQYGQLMLGSENDSFTPRRVAPAWGTGHHGDQVRVVRAGNKTSAVLAGGKSGGEELWTSGYGKHNALGFPSNKDSAVPVRVPIPSSSLQQVCLSEFGGAVVDDHGRLFSWGRNWSGENGNEAKTGCPELVPHSAKVVSVARGRQHMVFADDTGAVFACGSNADGALGATATDSIVRVKDGALQNEHIVQVACGRDFTFALSAAGELYSWGRNRWGQLGQGSSALTGEVQFVPQHVRLSASTAASSSSKIKQVECGESFTACVTQGGDLYLCGNGSDGQLGNGTSRAADVSVFQRVDALPANAHVEQVSCGGGHVACVLRDGRLFVWGRGRNGQLGRSDHVESVAAPRLTPVECTFFRNKRVLQVSCGADHTLVLVEEDDDDDEKN